MDENDVVIEEKRQSAMSKYGIWAIALLVAFLLGLLPMWWQYSSTNQTLEATQKQLQKAQIKDYMMTAIVEARNGEYEVARQNASEFFTSLNAEIEKGDKGFLTAEQREKLKTLFTNRDNMITLLAQRDPASADRLTDMYAVYKQAMAMATATTK